MGALLRARAGVGGRPGGPRDNGDACSVTFRDQAHAGQCRTGPDQQTACFPEDMRGPQR
jgi:hypothetical protein